MSHPFIPVANCASVELIYQGNGDVAENVFHVQKGSPFTLAQLQALRSTVDTWDNATWKNSRGSFWTLNRIRTKALDTSSSPLEDYTLPAARAGTVGGTNLPSNATFAVKLNTGLAGRSFRGRWFIVGLTTAEYGSTGNNLSSGTVSTFTSGLTSLLTALAGAGYTLGVVSYRARLAWRTTGLFTPAIGWSAVDFNIDSMRRRLAGRGI